MDGLLPSTLRRLRNTLRLRSVLLYSSLGYQANRPPTRRRRYDHYPVGGLRRAIRAYQAFPNTIRPYDDAGAHDVPYHYDTYAYNHQTTSSALTT